MSVSLALTGCSLPQLGMPVRRPPIEAEPRYLPRQPDDGAPLLPRLVPAPTGRNGYEQLLAAADQLRGDPALVTALSRTPEGQVFVEGRPALRRPAVRRAVILLRQGLGKPCYLSPGEPARWLWRPEASWFSRLAMLLHARGRWLMKEGRPRDALENAHLTIRFAHSLQDLAPGSLMDGLRIERQALRVLGVECHGLSGRDLPRLERAARGWHRERRTLTDLLRREVRTAHLALDSLPAAGENAFRRLFTSPDLEFAEDTVLLRELGRLRADHPERLAAAVAAARGRLDRYHQDCAREASRPPGERAEVLLPVERDLSFELAGRLVVVFSSLAEVAEESEALLRLLVCNAALRQYRDRHSRFPSRLALLAIGQLALDPFTGSQLRFERRGSGFRLASAGPLILADSVSRRELRLDYREQSEHAQYFHPRAGGSGGFDESSPFR